MPRRGDALMDAEQLRREEARRKNASLRKRGLSLSEQRSGSVREDSWDTCNSFLHDETRSREVVLRFGSKRRWGSACLRPGRMKLQRIATIAVAFMRSEEHTSELQSRFDLVCRLL